MSAALGRLNWFWSPPSIADLIKSRQGRQRVIFALLCPSAIWLWPIAPDWTRFGVYPKNSRARWICREVNPASVTRIMFASWELGNGDALLAKTREVQFGHEHDYG